MAYECDMNGLWSGEYRYPGAMPPVRFTAWFADDGGVLSGTTLEPNTFAPTPAEELGASLTGGRAGADVHFDKIYDPHTGIVQGPITYIGLANADFTRLVGTWSFRSGGPAGRFSLSRVYSAAAKAKSVRIAEPVGRT
jgi:hypothetical protein